jgi:hypothetical protein
MSERTEIFQKEPIGIARLIYLKCAKEKFTPSSFTHDSYDEIYDRITRPTRCLRFLKYGISRNIFLQVLRRKVMNPDLRDE